MITIWFDQFLYVLLRLDQILITNYLNDINRLWYQQQHDRFYVSFLALLQNSLIFAKGLILLLNWNVWNRK